MSLQIKIEKNVLGDRVWMSMKETMSTKGYTKPIQVPRVYENNTDT